MASNATVNARNAFLLKVVSFIALSLFLFIALRPSTHLTAFPKTMPETTAAAKALFKWQASLIERTAAIYNREARAKYTEPRNGAKWGDDNGNALTVDPEGHARFNLFDAFVDCPDGMVLERVGPAGEGGKMICSIDQLQPPCVVYSLGSLGDTRFESAVLMKTKCDIITFDCTVDVQPIHARHRFEKMCIGSEEKVLSDPEHFETIQDSMKRLGVKEISLLKMDIEGYEYDVMSSWTRDVKDYLPQQISFELHFGGMYFGTPSYVKDETSGVMFWPRRDVSLGELALLGYHLSNLGYGIVSREDNVECLHCTELTLYKIA
eukprot:TRINITY_DN5385_c0_g1_i1.p1 TRINITY_DN5385_c0_g1~~TRINITY_DN5385_c0_g1_i1.p1  ORF type:complete len:321 (+),score=50.93 TRINITY_DN5385_c0_g1_i1:269-1231(+)